MRGEVLADPIPSKFIGERMKCVICSRKITTDPDGWDGGHNAEPILTGRCCHWCSEVVIIRRLNDFQLRRRNNADA